MKAPVQSQVAVLGASPREDRYSFMAVHMLREHGFRPVPVHPAGHVVDGIRAAASLDLVDGDTHTLTVYVNSKISDDQYDRIIGMKPKRVIFNPGAENENLAEKLEVEGIEVLRACTLVLLRTGQF